MAARTEMLNPQVQPAPQELQDKHYYRKHGANAYYGQKQVELLFSSLSWISVPEKNIGYEFPIASFVFTEIHIQYFFSVRYRKSNELKSKTLLGSIHKVQKVQVEDAEFQ